MSTIPAAHEPQSDEEGYLLAMENMDASSPAMKMVGEELDAFLSRVRKRLNEISLGSFSEDELSKEIIKLVACRLGRPTARTIMTAKRSQNGWNKFEHDNYESVKSELRNPLFQTSFLSPSVAENTPRKEVIKELRKRYAERPTDEGTPDGSTASSSRVSTPSPVSRLVGDALIPERSKDWIKERKKRWQEMQKMVSPLCLCQY